MGRALIKAQTASSVETPDAGYIRAFSDSDNSDKLSYKNAAGSVIVPEEAGVQESLTLTAGAGLSGGGDLSEDRTFRLSRPTTPKTDDYEITIDDAFARLALGGTVQKAFTFPEAATAGSDFVVYIANRSTKYLLLKPAAGEALNGQAPDVWGVVTPGEEVAVACDGTSFYYSSVQGFAHCRARVGIDKIIELGSAGTVNDAALRVLTVPVRAKNVITRINADAMATGLAGTFNVSLGDNATNYDNILSAIDLTGATNGEATSGNLTGDLYLRLRTGGGSYLSDVETLSYIDIFTWFTNF